MVQMVTILFGALVLFGVLTQLVKSPNKANAVMSAGSDTITTVVHGFEGK
jgi:hypothetical protein